MTVKRGRFVRQDIVQVDITQHAVADLDDSWNQPLQAQALNAASV
jgi:hypothetical protein